MNDNNHKGGRELIGPVELLLEASIRIDGQFMGKLEHDGWQMYFWSEQDSPKVDRASVLCLAAALPKIDDIMARAQAQIDEALGLPPLSDEEERGQKSEKKSRTKRRKLAGKSSHRESTTAP
jgi:hypothetical protein